MTYASEVNGETCRISCLAARSAMQEPSKLLLLLLLPPQRLLLLLLLLLHGRGGCLRGCSNCCSYLLRLPFVNHDDYWYCAS